MNPKLHPRPDIPLSFNSNDDGIYLHKGENPFPPHPLVLDAMHKAAHDCNRYPDTNAVELRSALAAYLGDAFTAEHIIVGNGSDELIDLSVLCFTEHQQSVVTFEPSFFVYGFCTERHNRKLCKLQRGFDFHLPAYVSIKRDIPKDAALGFIANPNNPTGTIAPRELILEYIQNFPGIIVIDECYFEFCGETVVDFIAQHPNLVVLRSLSKSFGLAGLRLGYAVAQPNVIETLNRHAMTFPVNSIAQAAGIAVLQNIERYADHIEQLKQARETLRRCFITTGFAVPESSANFILIMDGPSSVVKELKTILNENRIFVSDQSKNVGKPALRIAAGTPDENYQLIQLVEKHFG